MNSLTGSSFSFYIWISQFISCIFSLLCIIYFAEARVSRFFNISLHSVVERNNRKSFHLIWQIRHKLHPVVFCLLLSSLCVSLYISKRYLGYFQNFLSEENFTRTVHVTYAIAYRVKSSSERKFGNTALVRNNGIDIESMSIQRRNQH